MEDVERGDVQPFCPFASLPGSARHEGEPIKPATGGRRQGALQLIRKEVSARLESLGRRKGKGQVFAPADMTHCIDYFLRYTHRGFELGHNMSE